MSGTVSAVVPPTLVKVRRAGATKVKSAGVYLLHFDSPLAHAQHYIGSTKDIDKRVEEHKKGQGARLTQVVRTAGIHIRCVRTWLYKDGYTARKHEKHLKHTIKNARRLCPICRAIKSHTGVVD